MTTLPALVGRLEAELYAQFPPAAEAAVSELAADFLALFGIDMPDAYRDLLLRSDGLDADGLVVYATHEAETDAGLQLGLRESNARLVHGDHDIDTPLRFIGEKDDTLLSYDTSDRLWKRVDRVGWEDAVDETYPDFETMVATLIRRSLDDE